MSSVGQAVGYVAGGIIGAFMPGGYIMLGAAIGGVIGGAIDPPKGPKIEGPRLSDLSVQTSTYGAAIPRVYGTIATFGNIFWLENNQIKESSKTESQGGKGGGGSETTAYSYSATFALGLGEGPIGGIKRIWISGKLIYDASASTLGEVLGNAEVTGGLVGGGLFRVYFGTDDQEPDARMQATLGIANTPAYRGLAYVVFYDLPLADFSNSLMGAQIKVEVVGPDVTSGWVTVLNNQNAGSGLPFVGDSESPRILSVDQGIISVGAGNGLPIHKYGPDGEFIGIGDVSNYEMTASMGYFVLSKRINDLPIFANQIDHLDDVLYLPDLTTRLPGVVFMSNTEDFVSGSTGVDLTVNISPRNGTIVGCLVDTDNSCVFIAHNATSATETVAYIVTLGGVIIESGGMGQLFNYPEFGYGNQGGSTGYTSGAFEYKTRIIARAEGGNSQRLSVRRLNEDMSLSSMFVPGFFFLPFSFPSCYVKDGIVYGVGCSYAGGGGENSVVANAYAQTSSATITLGDIVSAECLRSRYITAGDIDVSALTDEVDGYKLTAKAALRAGLEPLQAAWPFDVVPSGYKLKFVPRGGAVALTVPADDLGAVRGNDTQIPRLTTAREVDSQLPCQIDISYFDSAREYDTGTQIAAYAASDAVNSIALELPIVMDANKAAQVADVLLGSYWIERTTASFVLPPTYYNVEPADVLTVQGNGYAHEVRVTNISTLPDGRVEVEARSNNASTYVSSAVGAEGLLPVLSPITVKGPSIITLMDLPALSEASGSASHYAALCGALSSWTSGTLFKSSDGGTTWNAVYGFSDPVTMGYAVSTIGAGATNGVDAASRLEIMLYAGSLSSVTVAQMLAGANYFAYGKHGRWEIIAAASCVNTSDDQWMLGDMLRGQAGTEWAMSLHELYDDVVLLTDADLAFLPSSTSQIGIPALFSGVTSGSSVSESGASEFTYTGVNLRPLSPVFFAGTRHISTNEWSFSWIRRTRYGGEWRDFVDAQLSETSESYTLEIWNSSYTTLKRSIATTSPSATYSSALQVTDFGAVQDTLYCRVYQNSSSVGAGFPLTQTVNYAAWVDADIAGVPRTIGLHFNGTNGSTTFIDTEGHTMVANGSAQISTAQSKFGGASYLGASGATVTSASHADFAVGTGDFTVRAFIRVTSFATSPLQGFFGIGAYNTGTLLRLQADRVEVWIVGQADNFMTTINTGAWHHYAIVRKSGTTKVYFDGVSLGTNTTLTGSIAQSAVCVGASSHSTTEFVDGYIDDLEFFTSAIYDANFTPPTSAFG